MTHWQERKMFHGGVNCMSLHFHHIEIYAACYITVICSRLVIREISRLNEFDWAICRLLLIVIIWRSRANRVYKLTIFGWKIKCKKKLLKIILNSGILQSVRTPEAGKWISYNTIWYFSILSIAVHCVNTYSRQTWIRN